MVQTIKQQDRDLIGKIAALYTFFKENHDHQNEQKAKQLASKFRDKEFSIGFCGHFSAGKSSMINALIGEKLLPSSPIPTSANLVKIKSGGDYAKVYFKQGRPRIYPAPYDYEQVKTYCKNGDEISSIEISYSTAGFPEGVVIMDTPGIDSTDDAHRIATESALHLADIVFYVMDYNHVQSELNFLFTKQLTEAGKELYLVINQIDKHRKEELSFTTFMESVRESFASWGVVPAGIFYTSLKNKTIPGNEFSDLLKMLRDKINKRQELLPVTVFHSLRKLADNHFAFLVDRDEKEAAKYQRAIEELSEQEQQTAITRLAEMELKLEQLDEAPERMKKHLEEETENILKNAYLMPFQTRELAESYLASRQPDFKVGMFFTKGKTEDARNERLEKFYLDMQDKVKTQLEWHLRDLILQALKSEGIQLPGLVGAAQDFSVPFSKDLLTTAVKEGARLSGEYVLNYTNEVAEALKRAARNEFVSLRENLVRVLNEKNSASINQLDPEHKHLQNIVDAKRKLENIEEQQLAERFKMEEILLGNASLSIDQRKVSDLLANDDEEPEIILESASLSDNQEKQTTSTRGNHHSTEIEEPRDNELHRASNTELLVRKLRFTGRKIKSVPGLKKISDDLFKKAERLENNAFTVALFGAFSAGKSSFANALIGEDLLPVSPNPTTAAINKIKPVDKDHPHGTVLVKLKEEAVLLGDVQRSLSYFGHEASDFEKAITFIQKITDKEDISDAAGKMHISFLSAFYKGFQPFKNRLGETLQIDINEFREFVANEEKSCLVEWIEVYYECPLTLAGITLVDTPGADSINARHTGVAFEYIKNSDAILFVTYYNHAFSKADREFLIQLGRVKETFELDKMFFIVNAIDLADNEEEMGTVMEYVDNQLIQYGIRKPNLFAVSSLLALREKTLRLHSKESRIELFEQAFYSFISQDLMKIAKVSAETDLERASGFLKGLISSSMEDENVKRQKLERVKGEKQLLLSLIQSQTAEFLKNRLSQESDELTYYIKQRVFFRFGDFFREAFNPSVLKDDGRNMKFALQMGLEDFLDSFGFDFAQEMRATSLRIEAFMSKILKDFYAAFTAELASKSEGITFSKIEALKFAGIEFQHAFKDLDRGLFKKALSYFKNPKSFFEKNEKRYMAEELELALNEPADRYLSSENSRLKAHYSRMLEAEMIQLLQFLAEQTEEYYSGLTAALGEVLNIEQLKEIKKSIESFH